MRVQFALHTIYKVGLEWTLLSDFNQMHGVTNRKDENLIHFKRVWIQSNKISCNNTENDESCNVATIHPVTPTLGFSRKEVFALIEGLLRVAQVPGATPVDGVL